MMKNWTAMLCLCLGGMITCSNAGAAEIADYVFKNGAVYTIETGNPKAEAVAVTGKQIKVDPNGVRLRS